MTRDCIPVLEMESVMINFRVWLRSLERKMSPRRPAPLLLVERDLKFIPVVTKTGHVYRRVQSVTLAVILFPPLSLIHIFFPSSCLQNTLYIFPSLKAADVFHTYKITP
jgi:hypothetical protein